LNFFTQQSVTKYERRKLTWEKKKMAFRESGIPREEEINAETEQRLRSREKTAFAIYVYLWLDGG
jgi:hypothetical protein